MRRLVSSDEARPATCQHTTPCSDCPWSRNSLNGWLGGISIEDWIRTAHSDTHVECHVLTGVQCAGLAIYRRNVCKLVMPPLLRLEKDTEAVFAWPKEFIDHHSKAPEKPE